MLLHIKVKPKSRKDEIVLEQDGTISVRIKAPPVDGKANKYLIAFLAVYFGLSKSSVKLLKGETNQFKVIEIDAEELNIQKKLEQAQKDI